MLNNRMNFLRSFSSVSVGTVCSIWTSRSSSHVILHCRAVSSAMTTSSVRSATSSFRSSPPQDGFGVSSPQPCAHDFDTSRGYPPLPCVSARSRAACAPILPPRLLSVQPPVQQVGWPSGLQWRVPREPPWPAMVQVLRVGTPESDGFILPEKMFQFPALVMLVRWELECTLPSPRPTDTEGATCHEGRRQRRKPSHPVTSCDPGRLKSIYFT